MPRRARRENDGVCHHVIIKGHNGEPIVGSDEDRARLAAAIDEKLSKADVLVWAWTLLTTHAHFFLAGSIASISLALRDALGPYAFQWNAEHGRSGRLFNDRFWSRPVHDDAYALVLCLYIHLNALKAGIVHTREELEGYRWCSLGATLRDEPAIISVDADGILPFFSAEPRAAKDVLRSCLDDRIEQWRSDCRMGNLPAIIRVVAARHGLPPETITDGTRGRWFVEARRDVVIEARARGYSWAAIARALGMTRGGVFKLAA